MSLRKEQDLLARLLTNPGRQSKADADSSPDLNTDEIDKFAASLFHKRLHEIEKILPLTRRALDDAFLAEFKAFYPSSNPTSVRKHLEEAIGFCTHIRRRASLPAATRAVANFEAAKLRFFAFDKYMSFCAPAQRDTFESKSRRLSFALWVRIGKRVFHFQR